VRYLLRSGTLLASLWTLPASLGLVVFGRWVVGIYGIEFLPTSFTSLMILLVGVVVVNILYWNQLALLPLGHPDLPTKVQFGGAVFKVLGTVLLVPVLGAVGMALLLSSFLLVTTLALVWLSLVKLRQAERAAAQAAGA